MKRLWFAFLYALSGLRIAVREEASFQLELAVAVISIPLAVILAPEPVSLALMVGSVWLVLIVELLNTGIEAAIDRMGEEHTPLGKKAKDTAAAAVLLSILNAIMLWGILLL